MWNDRTKLLIGKDGTDRLENCSGCIVGLGGVGGYVCHMLARAGVGHLTLIDFDKVDETNINRQIVAYQKTVGKYKTDVLKDQVFDINPKCEVKTYTKRFNTDSSSEIFAQKYDFVVDAIDSVNDKIELICYCKEHDLPIVSAMGAGNRVGIPIFKILDIYKTYNDGLAKVMRKKLRERGIKKLDVACCEALAQKIDKRSESVGSISYYPAMCGCVLAAHVIENLLK